MTRPTRRLSARSVVMCAAAAVLLAAAPARASIFVYTLTAPDSSVSSFSLDTDSVATPFDCSCDPGNIVGFQIDTFGGTGDLAGLSSTTFINTAHGGGVSVFSGPQLYSGTEDHPTFLTSPPEYQLHFLSGDGPIYRLSVSSGGPGGPAPEVGVGLLSALAAGFGLAFARGWGRKQSLA